MKTFRRGDNLYDEYMDSELIIELCDAMNSLPGIRTSGSCSGHGKHGVWVFFHVHPTERHQLGLFFLTRCVDRRYWKYGHKWSISLSVGDQMKDDHLPTTYLLASEHNGKEAYDEVRSLLENIEQHLNHENFISGYKLDMSKFDLVEKDE